MQRKRKQNGTILQISGRWYIRYWQPQTVSRCAVCGLAEGKHARADHRYERNSTLERKRVTHLLGPVTTRGKTAPNDIAQEAERHMIGVNQCSIPAEQVISLTDFVESVFLPAVERGLAKSSYRAYSQGWKRYLRPLVRRERLNMKDIRCHHVQRWLDSIATNKRLARATLGGLKTLISASFKEAKRLGYFDGENPARDTRVDPHARAPVATHAYSLEEISTMLALLPEPAATIFAVAAYSGLRRGEVEGLRWEDYDGMELHVSRGVCGGEIIPLKTEGSKSAVPVIPRLATRLALHRARSGNPIEGWMFGTGAGTPLSLHNVVNRQILPALNRCRHCGQSEDDHLPHLLRETKPCAGYERDDRMPGWHGFHACRRGLGTNLYHLGVLDKVIQKILRHSNVNTTMTYYVKGMASDVTEAMEKLEQNLSAHELQDTNRTLKPGSGATLGLVN